MRRYLQSVILGSPAGDGVHCEGTCTLRNVWWNDVGEDAATFKDASGGVSYVIGGGARSASDKINTSWGDTATITRVTLIGGDVVCGEFKGVAKGGESTYLGEGWNDGYCEVTKSDITYK